MRRRRIYEARQGEEEKENATKRMNAPQRLLSIEETLSIYHQKLKIKITRARKKYATFAVSRVKLLFIPYWMILGILIFQNMRVKSNFAAEYV